MSTKTYFLLIDDKPENLMARVKICQIEKL
jgi:hypothetical protein